MANQYTVDELTEFVYLMELYRRFDAQLEKLRIAARDFSEGSDNRYAAILAECDKLRYMIVEMESLEPLRVADTSVPNL